MKRFGLIGYPLGHSFSKKYFTDKFVKLGLEDHVYDLYELKSIDLFPEIWEDADLIGVNVTVPYKESVKKYLSEFDQSAKKVGAVNVVKRINGKLKGYNSDYYGFKTSLENFLNGESLESALVLGTGGSSRAVSAVLKDLKINSLFVSRTPEKSEIGYDQLNKQVIADHHLIINTTPLGMYPNIKVSPNIPYEFLTSDHYLIDLIYNPSETQFMKKGLLRGTRTKNGLEMLHLQADKSWEIWNS